MLYKISLNALFDFYYYIAFFTFCFIILFIWPRFWLSVRSAIWWWYFPYANTPSLFTVQRGRIKVRKRKEEEKLRTAIPVFVSQVSETEINGQFESVCESVFSEVESQAMEALDLPGSFRTRSHSYLRAIQAGYSQDDDCLPSMTSSTVTSTFRSTTGKKNPPPSPPKKTSKGLDHISSCAHTVYSTYLHMYSGVPLLSLSDARMNEIQSFIYFSGQLWRVLFSCFLCVLLAQVLRWVCFCVTLHDPAHDYLPGQLLHGGSERDTTG